MIAGYCNWSYHPALASTPVQHARVGHSPIGAENIFGQGHCTPSRRTLEYFIPSLSALFIPLILGKKNDWQLTWYPYPSFQATYIPPTLGLMTTNSFLR